NDVNSEGTEKKVVRLGERAIEAQAGVTKSWPSLMQRQIDPYKALADVAATLNLPGSAKLSTVKQRLEAASVRPPTTKQAAESIRDDLETLRKSVEKLGLKGDAGRFLVKASQGIGDPKDLFKDDVKAFFDDHKLWSLLAVKTK